MDYSNDAKKTFLAYRDFATIGDKNKCAADLVSLTYMMVVTDLKNTLLVKYSSTSKIYSSIFDAKGQIINPGKKKIMEDFFDGYVIDLKNYLEKNLM